MQKYDDKCKRYLKYYFEKIVYLQGLYEEVLQDLYYQLIVQNWSYGKYIFLPGDFASHLVFIT